jgi:hypothetical protein
VVMAVFLAVNFLDRAAPGRWRDRLTFRRAGRAAMGRGA